MKYIDDFYEFVNKTNAIYEKHKFPNARRTGNELANILGDHETIGHEIFNTINKNVESLENLIDEFNKKHEVKVSKSPLEVKIDKTKLDLNYLISLTKLKKTSFVSDIIVSNILNYKILIRPIKNARIIALAYKYYLALVRHALQNALISIELSSDLFFTQINASLSGRRKQMKDMLEKIQDDTEKLVLNTFSGKEMIDPKTGKTVSIKTIIGNSKMKEITQFVKTQATIQRNMNDFDRSIGYNQNVFQDFGRTLESQVKTFQDKEIQSLADKFTTIANSTTGLGKENQAEAKEHVSNYANSVKQSVEARAMVISSQICVNMFEIIKMFSLRNIDNFSEVFEDASTIEKNDENWQRIIDETVKTESERWQKKIKLLTGEAQNIELTDDEKDELKNRWKEKGIDKLCSLVEFNNIFDGKGDLRDILKKNRFTDSQIRNILDSNEKVDDYGKIYYEDYREYAEDYGTDDKLLVKLGLKDDTSKNNDDIMCWLRKDSLSYEKLTSKDNSKKLRIKDTSKTRTSEDDEKITSEDNEKA